MVFYNKQKKNDNFKVTNQVLFTADINRLCLSYVLAICGPDTASDWPSLWSFKKC